MWAEVRNRWLVLLHSWRSLNMLPYLLIIKQIPVNISSRSAKLPFTCRVAANRYFPNLVVCRSIFVFDIIYHIFSVRVKTVGFLVPYRLILVFLVVYCDRRWIFVALSLSLFSCLFSLNWSDRARISQCWECVLLRFKKFNWSWKCGCGLTVKWSVNSVKDDISIALWEEFNP